jgi:translation initiation factor 3 subunit F
MTQSLPQADVAISPSVLFAIGEIYQRRSDQSTSRVVGALFGQVQAEDDSSSTKINVRHCFAVPHSEVGDQISINSEYYKLRSELHRKCYGKDSLIVGWFSIAEEGAKVSEKNTEFINDSFGREVVASSALPLNVHLSLTIGASGIKKAVNITDMSSKHQISAPAQLSCSSHDSFARTSNIFADDDLMFY